VLPEGLSGDWFRRGSAPCTMALLLAIDPETVMWLRLSRLWVKALATIILVFAIAAARALLRHRLRPARP
jgi:hypothetical protein